MALFLISISELPEILTQNTTNVCQKGKKSPFFYGKITSGNPDVVFLTRARRPMVIQMSRLCHQIFDFFGEKKIVWKFFNEVTKNKVINHLTLTICFYKFYKRDVSVDYQQIFVLFF